MPRIPRGQVAGHAYHGLTRGTGGAAVVLKESAYTALLDLLATAKSNHPVKLLGFCLMPNHFHLAVQPATDVGLNPFMQWWMTSHVRRYHRHSHSHGHGWQGCFKSFPIQQDHASPHSPPLRTPQSCPCWVGPAREGLALVQPAILASEYPLSRRGLDRVAPSRSVIMNSPPCAPV